MAVHQSLFHGRDERLDGLQHEQSRYRSPLHRVWRYEHRRLQKYPHILLPGRKAMTEIDDAEVLRREIRTMLEKVTDRGSLIFYQWLVRRVLANYPIPRDEELRALHQAFIRMHATFRAKKRPTKEDMELVSKWTEGDAESMGRALGRPVKFFREKRGMSRLQLGKKARLPVRAILAIERGRGFDLSTLIDNLTIGLSVEAGALTAKVLDFEKDDKS